jgi:plastocyanin domain-containing protein
MKRVAMSIVALLSVVGVGTLVLSACQQTQSGQAGKEVQISVTDKGFEPAEVHIPAGQAVTLVMTRKTDQTCATEVEFASLKQTYKLPLNQAVRISLPGSQKGVLNYECGMHMLSGRIVVQ